MQMEHANLSQKNAKIFNFQHPSPYQTNSHKGKSQCVVVDPRLEWLYPQFHWVNTSETSETRGRQKHQRGTRLA